MYLYLTHLFQTCLVDKLVINLNIYSPVKQWIWLTVYMSSKKYSVNYIRTIFAVHVSNGNTIVYNMYTCLQDWYIVIHWHELASVLLTISNDNTIFYNTYTCFTRFIYSNTLTWEAGISSIKPGVCPFALDVVSYLCYSLTNTLCKQL